MLYQDDPLNESLFPNGFGEITDKGKQQLLNIGEFLQRNYSEFFAGNLTGQTEVKAANQGRVIDSARLLMRGLKSKNDCDEVESLYVDSVSSKVGDCLAFSKEIEEQRSTEHGQKILREGQVFGLPFSFLIANLTCFFSERSCTKVCRCR